MSRPTLGLTISPASDPLLTRFLAILARWSSVRQARASDLVDGWIVTDDVDPRQISAGLPVLVWTRDASPAVEARWPGAVFIGPRSESVPRGLRVPEPNVDATTIPYVAPLVRARWRQRYGLPSDLVLRVDDAAAADVSMSLRPTALAVAAVVIATGDSVVSALAWGAPTVTDERTSRRLKLGPAVEAVAEPHLVEAARRLSHSETRMAELAWLGRVLVEEAFDLASVAYAALQMTGLEPPHVGAGRVISRLNDLWATPESSWSIIRAIGR